MPTMTNVSWVYDENESSLKITITLDTMPSSSVYRGLYVEKGDPTEYDGYPSWTQNNTQKTITFDYYWWEDPSTTLDSIILELPYETLAKSLVITIKNDNGTPVFQSYAEKNMYRLDFTQAPFNGDYYIGTPGGVFFQDGTKSIFSDYSSLVVFYPTVINTFFEPSKIPEKFSIVQDGEKQLLFLPEAGSTNRFEITDILDPEYVIIDLNQDIDFATSDFWYTALELDENDEEIGTLYIGLDEQLGFGLIEQLAPNQIKFYYWGNYSGIQDTLLFEFDNSEFVRLEKVNDVYTVVLHTGPLYKRFLLIDPKNGYKWDADDPIYLTLYNEDGSTVAGYLDEYTDDEFAVEIFDEAIYWIYYSTGEYTEIVFEIPAYGTNPAEELTYVAVDGEYYLKGDEPEPEKTPVWESKNKDGSELPHTTSNYVIEGNSAIIVIRSETAISSDFTWWRFPESGFEEDIIYKTPTTVEMLENNTKAILTITPYPKGEFYIENGDFTKLYKLFDLDEQNVDIQFSNQKIQVIANQQKYFFKSSTPTLKLYKIVQGKAEVVPTVMFTGGHNSSRWRNPVGQLVGLGTTNFNFQLWGIYEGKEFTPGNYKFVFSNMEFLKPYTMNKGFEDILYYGPNGIADGYHTGDEFYEIDQF